MLSTRAIAAALLAAWLLGGCTSSKHPGTSVANSPTPGFEEVSQNLDGLRFRLSQSNSAPPASAIPQASATPLSPTESGPLLNSLPPMQHDPSPGRNQPQPSTRAPAPKPRTVAAVFPAPQSEAGPPALAPGPLEILSCTPQGPVEMAPQLQVTFNQPMLALSDEHQPDEVPAQLSPQPNGRWRWLGTQTLIFQPQQRFPMASRFELKIPAGISSASGSKLKDEKLFSFQTPTLQLTRSFPEGSGQGLQPLLYLEFNQDIQPDKLAPMLKLLSNSEEIPLRQARREQVLEDEAIQTRIAGAGPRRYLVMAPTHKLSPGQAYSVEIPAGAPSAEGPMGTEKSQSFSFSTYDPLKATESELKLEPGQQLTIQFNNRLDSEKFDPKWVRLQPEVPDLKVEASDQEISLSGRFKGRSHYEVGLAPALVDEFGQKLGQAEKIQVTVGEAQPAFSGPTSSLLTLDPAKPPELNFEVTNYPSLRLRAWKVAPPHWQEFVNYLADPEHLQPPGKLMLEQQISTGIQKDEPRPVRLDLKSVFPNGLGQAVVMVEPQSQSASSKTRFLAWVQATKIGLDACSDDDQLVAWVSHLESGAPWPDAGVQLLGFTSQARSGADGLAVLHPETSGTLLIARQGDDLTILPKNFNGWNSGAWNFHQRRDTNIWHVVDDRHLYRPGERVHLKGWLRKQLRGPDGQLAAAAPGQVSYRLEDARAKKLAQGQVRSGGLGGFSLELALPARMAPGPGRLVLSGPEGSSYVHQFEVQEFRRPEFEVKAQAEPGVSQVGQSALLSAQASYFSGGPLANAKVDWRVSSSPTRFSPPGWEQYSFGSWEPWWDFAGSYGPGGGEVRDNSTEQSSSTDARGNSNLKLDFLSVDPPQPHNLVAEATVHDLNQQTWSTQTSLLVHPASIYIGLKSQSTFVPKGQPFKLELVVTDLEGKPVPGRPLQLRLYRQQWGAKGERRRLDQVERQLTSGPQPLSLEIPTGEAGSYVLEARVQDEQNRANASDLSLWVDGAEASPGAPLAEKTIQLIPNRRQYHPGETAEVLVQTPFAPAELLVTTRRDGLSHVERLSAPQGRASVKIPLREMDVPGLELQVDALGQDAQASGSLFLEMSSATRQLAVEVKPGRAALQPGQTTQVEVQLKDERGQPTAGLVTLLAVDESVLALSGYDPADPLSSFCVRRQPGVEDQHSREFLELNAGTGFAPASVPSADYNATEGSAGGAQPPPPPPPGQFKMRSNFTPLAAFAPDVATDPGGRARIAVHLPDNLTRYRLIALAESGLQRFGKGESSLTARKPLQIRATAPRFANFGDRFQLPVLVQNQTDQALQVELVARASHLKLKQNGYRLQLQPQEQLQLNLPCTGEQAGTARLQLAATSVAGSDAAEISLPIYTPASLETFATYGQIDQGGVRQPVQRPARIFPQLGEFSLTTSSTALAELTDSFQYLRNYPFECSEQLASRVLASTTLQDGLEASQPDLDKDLARLGGLQNEDGGFDYWEQNQSSDPFLTVHVAHALLRLKQQGSAAAAPLWDKVLPFLKNIQPHLDAKRYAPESRRAIRAYALYVLERAGLPDADKVKTLLDECPLEQQGPEVLAWLLPSLSGDAVRAERVLKYLENHSSQTASSAQFSFTYHDQPALLLYSDRRDEALILEALLRVRPNHPLVPKLVRSLLEQRRQGRWENTQENCWALLAMDAYFKKFEKATPNFRASLWLGEKLAVKQKFTGRQSQPQQLRLPLAELPEKTELLLSKQGTGRLYYRLGLSYAPFELNSPPLDNGFALERSYQAVEDNRDVSRDGNGIWHIKAGALVRVQLILQTPSARHQVALVDRLPAGLEALNSELLGIQSDPAPANRLDGWWSSYWFDHQNLRDERVEVFAEQLSEGVYNYSYLARATTSGQFTAPPARAEEMYHPETFGRCASEKVVIE